MHLARASEEPSATDTSENTWRTTEEVAAMLKVDPSTIRRWRTARPPQGPPFVRLSARLTLYNIHDVQRWLNQHRIDPREVA
ncbi:MULTISPECIES: helix-turn-helix domain-containing protein [unclassified Nonomuraea]|uniref:helix-turn-helix transcriptional regulator n=1 Tax=unclassified Nonomuraea TaxID=2593643 RepID=UPI0033C5B4E4